MRAINYLLLTGTAAAWLCLTAGKALAQNDHSGGGKHPWGGHHHQDNLDPAQLQQQIKDRYRTRLEITDDAEWKVIQRLIQNVLEARMAIETRGWRPSTHVGRPRGDGNSVVPAHHHNSGGANAPAEELQKAIDSKAPPQAMKAALAKYVAYRNGKQVDLKKAQEELRAVLTSRQEAIAVLSGLL